MFKRSLAIVVALVLVVGACGGNSTGSSAERYQGCSKEGEKVKGKDGLPLACVMNSAGELAWEVDGDAPITGDFAQGLSSIFC